MRIDTFQTSAALSLGVELELQIVDPQGHDLTPRSAALLERMAAQTIPGRVTHEITASMLELCTGVCSGHAEVQTQLRQIRDALAASADAEGVALSGGGTHPFQLWTQRQVIDAPRYKALAALYGYLSKQFTVFGQHVHVGCTGPDQALLLLHRLSRYVPHLIALASSSPYMQGEDTAFHSARSNVVSAFPLSGHAPFILQWDAFCDHFDKMQRTGIVQGMKDFYWDIRPKPEYGTVEIRVMDTPLQVDKAAALAGLVQCLALWLLEDKPFTPQADDYLCYAYNRFQASRFGLDAVCIDPGSQQRQRLRDALATLLQTLRPHARALGAEAALDQLAPALADNGTDADWLRRCHDDGTPLPELVALSCRRWLH
jgi:carboxylate-amine ligase